MELLFLKIVSALAIFIASIAGGAAPILIQTKKHSRKLVFYGEVFARGVFLGAGLIHLLPEAHKSFQRFSNLDYPLVFTLCAFTIAALRIIEQGVTHFYSTQSEKQPAWRPYLLTIILSLHSLIAGAALGVEELLSGFFVIFIAIIAHKSAAAFSLGVNMRKHGLPRPTMFKLMLLFSMMTPTGIIVGSAVAHLAQTQISYFTQGVFDTVAAGTFIYIATFDSEGIEKATTNHAKLLQVLCFLLGLSLMALVSV